MAITRWDPFQGMMRIQERVNQLFQESLGQQRGQESIESGQWSPAVDIFETGDRIVLRADLPGIEQSDIELRVDDNTLLLRGERRIAGDLKPEDYHRAERPHGTFVRSFGLPGNVDQAAIRATHKNGVLEVILPKRQESKAKAIRVEVK
ncbi:MAG TPA: Hsp20/alpha crystallin family protein [Candidatus Polarisedimenticolia bacterium]|nr:Hsp20/alpha crystallin family protein [Candidatus Polarisedimenticolia bacterium]